MVPETPAGARSGSLCFNFLIWKTGTGLFLLLSAFQGQQGGERRREREGMGEREGKGGREREVRCFELSDYIKVKVLRTEISKLQGKSA